MPDALLAFAAYLLIRGTVGSSADGALIYAGTGTLGLWMTMRTEWRRNRRDDEQQRDDDAAASNGDGSS